MVSALTKEAVATQQDATISGEDDTGDHAQPIASTVEKMKSDIEAQTGISQDAKDIMRKEILIEKKKLRSHKKVELEMISDPLGTIHPGLISEDLAISNSLACI